MPGRQAIDDTVSSLMSSQLLSSSTRSARNGAISAMSARNASSPLRDLVDASLRDDEPALPVLAAVDQHEDPAAIEPADRLSRRRRAARQPHPEDVDRGTDVLDFEPGPLADRRVPPVRADRERGAGPRAVHPASGADADDLAPSHRIRSVTFGLHPQVEGRDSVALLGEEVEEVPLRHQGDEPATVGRCEKSAIGHRRPETTPRRCRISWWGRFRNSSSSRARA